MRCKTCDYPLWNLTGRTCPECGTTFVPSDFEFAANSVQYCCPHCQQGYYGTDVKGHLVPQEFNCVSCSRRITMDEMVLRPAQGVTELQTRAHDMPWLERKQRGWIKAWGQMVWKSMFSPVMLMRSVPVQEPTATAWRFAIATIAIVFGIGAGIPIALFGFFMMMNRNSGAMGFFAAVLLLVAGGILSMILVIALWGLTAHGILLVSGGTKHTIGRTYQSLLYSTGSTAVMAFPCLGLYCGTSFMCIWWAISAILMLTVAQSVRGGRASLAVLAFPGALVLLVMASYATFVVSITTFTLPGRIQAAGPQAVPSVDVISVTYRVLDHARDHAGAGPSHAAALINQQFTSQGFIASHSATNPRDVMVGSVRLSRLDELMAGERRGVVEQAAAALPPNIIAHRCGDFVFTYHGIDLNNCHGGLWIVVLALDPASNVSTIEAVGLADGSTRTITGNVSNALAEQNHLRALHNLPPLPDPCTVTHANPATAGNVPTNVPAIEPAIESGSEPEPESQ